jgi:hypothetical protein
MALKEEQLKEMNKYREGKLYTDQDVAMAAGQHKGKNYLQQVLSFNNLSMGRIMMGTGHTNGWCANWTTLLTF